MNAGLKHWLSVFGPAAVLASLFAAPVAIEHGWGVPVRLGRVALGILQWLVFALIFTLIVYRPSARDPRRMRDWLVTFGAAALFGLLAVGPFAFMEVYNNPGFARESSHSRLRCFTECGSSLPCSSWLRRPSCAEFVPGTA